MPTLAPHVSFVMYSLRELRIKQTRVAPGNKAHERCGSSFGPHTLTLPPDQVLHDTWSVILHTDAEYSSVTVAPFQGVQTPPYNGDTRVDSRDLLYDPRGWWKHAHAVKMNSTVGPSPGRLHRLSRGLSASGLPWGAGSLNEALGNTRGEAPGLGEGGLGGERGNSLTNLPGKSVGEAWRDRAGIEGGIQRVCAEESASAWRW